MFFNFCGSTLLRDMSFHLFGWEVQATSSSVRLRPVNSTWHMMAAAWLQQEARLVRWIDLLVKVSEFRSSQYLLCETYPAMHVQLAVRMYP
jgi:hypothetical protein